MSCSEIHGATVHELGHILSLKHNASSRSIMYLLNVNGTGVLDSKDILDLRLTVGFALPSPQRVS
jgi:predicted Zn-dependent protease